MTTSISAISSLSALLDFNTTQRTSTSAATSSAKASSTTPSSGQEEKLMTLKETLPDGSILLIVKKGNTTVSETKVAEPTSNQNANNIATAASAAKTQLDKFNDTSSSCSALTGALFNAEI